ncbi:MAG: hypothetical protein LBQ95_00425 [Lachnospiraceae bacterium]|nr:hypothetical protein [Lachnospiraceae bacterium]
MRELPTRKPNRLAGYDYSQNGAYFITICAKDREQIFGRITTDGVGANCVRPCVRQSETGNIVLSEIERLNVAYPSVNIDCFVVMPNHVHMIIVIDKNGGINKNDGRTQFAPTISRIIKQWKGAISKQIGFSPWQKSFHDHIIRNEQEYIKIAEYIENNPKRWADDCFYGGEL